MKRFLEYMLNIASKKENELRVKEHFENVKKGKSEVISSLTGEVTIPWCSWRKRGKTKYLYVCVCLYVSILLDNQVNNNIKTLPIFKYL